MHGKLFSMSALRTIKYGDELVPVLERRWLRRKEMTPYFRTDLLTTGQCWKDAPTRGKFTEHYVQDGGQPLPVGVAIARELKADGARI